MTVYHVTAGWNVPPIILQGLCCRGRRMRVVWLCTHARLAWAILHVSRHHAWRPKTMRVLRVRVPRAWIRRWRRGIWICARDIPRERISYGTLDN